MVTLLAGRSLRHVYAGPGDGVRALDGVDVAIQAGELVAFIGPNGSGKSTLLRCLAGLLAPTSGDVSISGDSAASLDDAERARRVGVVPQYLPRLPGTTVRWFVLGGRYARIATLRGPAPADFAAASAALAACDVAGLDDRMMDELSGGQRQRVLLARAIAQEPRVLLIDEPTAALDPEHQVRVFDLIARHVDARRSAVVITHDLNLASQYATRLVVLDAGKVVAEGKPADVLRNDVLEPVYGRSIRFGELTDGAVRRPFVIPWRSA